MTHHFDTPTAMEDPRINICDFYLFRGHAGTAVMALTVNPDAGISGTDTFRDDAIYAFRFDLNEDTREEVTFKIRFGPHEHSDYQASEIRQPYEVYRSTGRAALRGIEGKLILNGVTNRIVDDGKGIRAFAGLAPDLFAGDAAALGAFRKAFHSENRFDPSVFEKRVNFFERRNVTAIVLEVPIKLIGHGLVRSWATVSLYGHAPEIQVSRWGLPLITNVFMPDLAMREDYNRTAPVEDYVRFAPQIGSIAEGLTRLANSATDPIDYATHLIERLCPTLLPYELDTAAAFNCDGFNGRSLTDDVMDVMLNLVTNTKIAFGVTPDRSRMRDEFPYFGNPYTQAEQLGVIPARPAAKTK